MPELRGRPGSACKKHACALQACLKKSQFDVAQCEWAVEALRACCREPRARGSLHCAFDEPAEGGAPPSGIRPLPPPGAG
jgi:hypothetical protein